jgi:hypothetical protein
VVSHDSVPVRGALTPELFFSADLPQQISVRQTGLPALRLFHRFYILQERDKAAGLRLGYVSVAC